jgi:hypothetical protein
VAATNLKFFEVLASYDAIPVSTDSEVLEVLRVSLSVAS